MLEAHSPVVSSLCLGSARRQAFSPIGTIDLPRSGGAFFMRSCRVLDTATNGSAGRFIVACRRSSLLSSSGVGLGGKPLWEVASKLSPVPMAGLFCRVGNGNGDGHQD